jgi:hypothetical protein
LVLSDTFHTWFDRTNQIIEKVNPLNLYEIYGLTGIELVNGRENCNYNGVMGLGFKYGPGLAVWKYRRSRKSNGWVHDKIYVDPRTLPAAAMTANTVSPSDLVIFKDLSDTSKVSDGTPKYVEAAYMLPNRLMWVRVVVDFRLMAMLRLSVTLV